MEYPNKYYTNWTNGESTTFFISQWLCARTWLDLDLNVLMNYPSPNLILQERFDYLNIFDSTRFILKSGFGQGNERDLKNILNYNSWTPDRPIVNGDS